MRRASERGAAARARQHTRYIRFTFSTFSTLSFLSCYAKLLCYRAPIRARAAPRRPRRALHPTLRRLCPTPALSLSLPPSLSLSLPLSLPPSLSLPLSISFTPRQRPPRAPAGAARPVRWCTPRRPRGAQPLRSWRPRRAAALRAGTYSSSGMPPAPPAPPAASAPTTLEGCAPPAPLKLTASGASTVGARAWPAAPGRRTGPASEDEEPVSGPEQ